jgi:gliding motility-associated-like protein
LFCFVLFCFVNKSKGQNLVKNYSFEDTVDCNNPSVENATGWCSVGKPFFGHMTTCQVNSLFSVPRQLLSWFDSYQIPRTGKAYGACSVYAINGVNYAQAYAQTKLKQTLITGKNYCVTYYVSLFNNDNYSIDKMGAYLTNVPFNCTTTSTTQIRGMYTPQVFSPAGVQLDDTLGWMEISGLITATGTEDYLVIGDFFLEAQHSIVNSYPTNINGVAEYYVDDVSVEEVQLAQCKNDTSICLGDSVLLGNNVSEATTYNWLPNVGLSCNTCANPKAKPLSTTTYTCFKTQCKANTNDAITITVKTDCNPVFEIPNVFTPNFDGVNDTFWFNVPANVSDLSFVVYNRWGNVVASAPLSHHSTIIWDGRTTSGEPCNDGVYFYTLSYKLQNGDKEKKNGFITLIR